MNSLPKYAWVEKFRPTSLEQCVFPKRLNETFAGIIDSKQKFFPNMLFFGGHGCGKTTVATAICDQTDHEYALYNASLRTGMDTLRTEIIDFVKSVSFSSHRKCVILDEADRLSGNFQDAMKGLMEEFSINASFIFTTNHRHKVSKGIQSRCTVIDFSIDKSEREEIKRGITSSIKAMLKEENVPFDKEALNQHVERYFPDFRRTINELQAYSISRKKIDSGILSQTSFASSELSIVTELVRTKSFRKLFEYAMTVDYDPGIFDDLWKYWVLEKIVDSSSVADLTLIASDYDDRSTHQVSPALTLCAFLTQVATNCKFK